MLRSASLLMVLGLLGSGCDEGSVDDTSSSSSSAGAAGGGAAGPGPTGPGAGASGPGPGGSGPVTVAGLCDGGPLAEPVAGCTPTPFASTGDPHQDCVDRINQFRWECQCLPPLARWTEAEGCSNEQSATDQSTNSPHGNFGDCGENAQNTCPNWGSTTDVISNCLQSMWNEGPGEPFEEHGHYINMSSTGYSKVACGFAENGGVWSNQNFAP